MPRHGRTREHASGIRNDAEERIRHLLVQAVAEREKLRGQLIGFARLAEHQAAAGETGIPDLEHRGTRDLVLEVKAIVLPVAGWMGIPNPSLVGVETDLRQRSG